MKLIDKDAIVAELERKMQELRPTNTHQMQVGEKMDRDVLMWLNALTWVKKILDTLEGKEVDSELNSFDATVCKIGNTYLKEMDKDAIAKALEPYKNEDKVKVIIKAQKGE